MSGTACFRGTRVPIHILFEHLKADRLSEFYAGYPEVTNEQVNAVLETSEKLIVQEARLAA